MTYENFDTETLPHLEFGEQAPETTVETEEYKLKYHLCPIRRDQFERDNGLLTAWRGPSQDRIVLL